MTEQKREILAQLQRQILTMQGFIAEPSKQAKGFGLGPLEACFPNAVFPLGTIHEFITDNFEESAASEGFVSGLLSKLMANGQTCLWISRNRRLFPPAMQRFNVTPQLVIFVDVCREKDILWVMEEALKCEGLAAVIAELPDIDFAQSRRFQLAVEKSKVTGILLRKEPKRSSATACTVRWHIKPQTSVGKDGLPGVGNPRWEVELLKVRNGATGRFSIEWDEDHFAPITSKDIIVEHAKQVG